MSPDSVIQESQNRSRPGRFKSNFGQRRQWSEWSPRSTLDTAQQITYTPSCLIVDTQPCLKYNRFKIQVNLNRQVQYSKTNYLDLRKKYNKTSILKAMTKCNEIQVLHSLHDILTESDEKITVTLALIGRKHK